MYFREKNCSVQDKMIYFRYFRAISSCLIKAYPKEGEKGPLESESKIQPSPTQQKNYILWRTFYGIAYTILSFNYCDFIDAVPDILLR